MSAVSVWQGHLSFGLISAPVRIYTAARDQHISFNQLHAPCGCRINQQTVCNHCAPGKKIDRAEIVKGYEVEKNTFVRITDEEVTALAPKSSNTMNVEHFVALSDIDPLNYDASYYMVPDEAGRKVYALLYETMKGTGKGAVVKVTIRNREHLALIRPYKRGLTLHTLFYDNEVREVSEFGGFQIDNTITDTITDTERNMADQILQSSTKPFNSAAYCDEFAVKILALIESKKSGTASPVLAAAKAASMDLMAMLAGSLKMAKEASAAVTDAPVAVPVAVPKAKKSRLASAKA